MNNRYRHSLWLMVLLLSLLVGCVQPSAETSPKAVITATATAGMIGMAEIEQPAMVHLETATPAPTEEPQTTDGDWPVMRVDITQFRFPERIVVPAGTEIVFLNNDGIIHSVTSGIPDAPDGVFDTGFFPQGEERSVILTEPDIYTYFCMRHNFMQGMIEVTGEGGKPGQP